MNEWMCIYIPHISLYVSWRFTILLSEIGRQLMKAPLAAAISPYLISLTHPTHGQNRWQQTNGPTLQKQNNPEQSLIEICYQHLSYSLKLAVKKSIIKHYIKQPADMLMIWSKYFQNMKVNNSYWKLFPFIKASSSSILKATLWGQRMNRGCLFSFHSSWLQHWLWINIQGNQFFQLCILWSLLRTRICVQELSNKYHRNNK